MTESVINTLAQIPQLHVMARNTVFSYKGREVDPRKVGQDLHVDAVLTGKVVQQGDSLDIQTELVDVSSGNQMWGNRYHRSVAGILAVQEEIAKEITDALRLKLTGEDEKRISKHYTENSEAYQLYLRGRYYFDQRTGESMRRAIDLFQEAINKDPNYALAYAGLANAYVSSDTAAPPRANVPKAKAAAMKALELDKTLGDAHAALALVEWFYDWDWSSAEREFKAAIEINPNSAISHQWYSECLLTRTRFDEGIGEMKRALELDPISTQALGGLGHGYLVMRRYDEAIPNFQKALDLYPNTAFIRAQLAWSYAMKRMYPQALAEYGKIAEPDKAVAPDNQLVADGLGWLYAVAGRRADALKIAKEMEELSSRSYVDFYQLATIYAGLGAKDETFRLLEKGYQQRSTGMLYLVIDTFWDNVQSDPRYADLARRLGLPQVPLPTSLKQAKFEYAKLQ